MRRRLGLALIAAILLAGCASTSGSSRASASASDTTQAPRRCSPGDPDRWAWFCVVGQILYGAASFFSPVNETTMR